MIRFLTWTLTFLFILAFVGGIGALSVLYYFGRALPDYEQLSKYEPPVVSRLYASDGRIFAEYATQNRFFVPIEAIPQRVIQTFLAAEDKNFYIHPGLDLAGIIRAAIVNLSQMGTNKRPMGASTITQQVAKNLLLANISHQASLERKIKEAILAFRIETALSKDRILEIYLNEIYLGASSYGIASAALNYFNKSLGELSIAEVAFIAALPKAPSRYSPKTNYEAAKARRDWVITRMYEEGLITRNEALEAKAEPIVLKKPDPAHVVRATSFAEEVRRNILAKYGENAIYQGGLTIRTTLDPQLQKVADWALRKGLISYDRAHGWRGAPYHVTLKGASQNEWLPHLAAIPTPPGVGQWEQAIVLELKNNKAIIGLKSGHEGSIPLAEMLWARHFVPAPATAPDTDDPTINLGPPIQHPQDVLKVGDIVMVEKVKGDTYGLQQIPGVNGALVAMDPHTGRVFAVSGGFSFESSQYNRATQAPRQPGSAIKPFVYLAAMERGFSPETIVSDSAIAIAMGRGLGTYAPKNMMKKKVYGAVPLRVALQKSLNRVTIRLVHQYVGMKPVARTFEKFGIMDKVPMQIAMCLGAGETTLLRMTTAYAMLANGGKRLTSTLIDRIQDRHGKTIFTADTRTCLHCKDLLWDPNLPLPIIEDRREQLADPQSVYQVTSMLEGAVRAGTARRAQVLGKIIAAKTGTTNNEKDAWFFVYTPDLVVGCYVGYDKPQTLGHMQGGARVALPIGVDFLSKALDGVPSKPFKVPSGMKLVRVRDDSGQNSYGALKKSQGMPAASQYHSAGSSEGSSAPSSAPSAPPVASPHHGSEQSASYYRSHPPRRPQPASPAPSAPPPSYGPAPLTGTGGVY